MSITYNSAVLEMRPGAGKVVAHISQDDVGDTLKFDLYLNNVAYTIPTGATVTAHGTKANGLGFTVNCLFSDNTVKMPVTKDVSSFYGITPAEIVIKDSFGNIHGTANFLIMTERSPHPDGTLDGSSGAIVSQMKIWYESTKTASEIAQEKASEALHNALEAKEFRDSAAAITTPDGLAALVNSNTDRLHTLYFDTIADLKACTACKEGDYCKTSGYNSIGDTGGLLYHISKTNSNGAETLNSGLYAIPLYPNYLTPEMFGAFGDGNADDSNAFIKMFLYYESNVDSKPIYQVAKSKIYVLNTAIIINNVPADITILGTISYKNGGDEYALTFTCNNRISDKIIEFGTIISDKGCVAFYPHDGNNAYCAGMRFRGRSFYAGSDYPCVYVYNSGWFNENQFEYVNFAQGAYGLKFIQSSLEYGFAGISRLSFYRCHFEGINQGVQFDNNECGMQQVYFYDCRLAEPPKSEIFVKTSDAKITNTITIYGNTGSSTLRGGCYVVMNDPTYIDVDSLRMVNIDREFVYDGVLLSVPLNAPPIGYNIPDSDGGIIEVDLTKKINPVLLRTNYANTTVNISVINLPFSYLINIPVDLNASYDTNVNDTKYLFNIKTKTKTKSFTKIINSKSEGITRKRIILGIDYYRDNIIVNDYGMIF